MKSKESSLKKSILAEVVFEIRFNPIIDLSLIVGSIHDKLKKDYPEFENLNVPDFPSTPNSPEFIFPTSIVKYRFYSDDRKHLYSLGSGVLSIHTTDYESFEKFKNSITMVLRIYEEITHIKILSRMGLRYINIIPLGHETFNDVFKVNFTLPKNVQHYQKGFNIQSLGIINGDSFSFRLQSSDPTSTESVVLDLDYFSQVNIQFNLLQIDSWSIKAHKFILDLFNDTLTEDYLGKVT